MLVRELVRSPALTCNSQDSLQKAARLMWENDCGVLPVLDREGRVGAMITDRDICMAAYTQGRPLDELRVAACMSRQLVSCMPGDDIGIAVGKMSQHQVRRLPVLDADGRLVGIVSMNDLARRALDDAGLGRTVLQALAAICRPRAKTAAPAVAKVADRVGKAVAEQATAARSSMPG